MNPLSKAAKTTYRTKPNAGVSENEIYDAAKPGSLWREKDKNSSHIFVLVLVLTQSGNSITEPNWGVVELRTFRTFGKAILTGRFPDLETSKTNKRAVLQALEPFFGTVTLSNV